MISIESRKFLYDQLKEICRVSLTKEVVMLEEKFLSLTDTKLIEYVFKYRDRQKIYVKGKLVRAYIEMPDCDLEGCDLRGLELSRFVPGVVENGQIRKTTINLRNTNAIINLSTVFHNEERVTEDGCECITDFSECDFRGCKIYGRTQEEIKQYSKDDKIQYRTKGTEKLDELYLKRRRLHNLTKEQKELSDQIYNRLLNKFSIGFSLQKNQEVDLTDYDFSGLTEKEIEIIMKNVEGYKVNIAFTGIRPYYLGRENQYSQIMSLKDAVKIKDSDFIEEFIHTYPDRAFVTRFIENEYRKGRRSYSDLKKYGASNEVLKLFADNEYKKNPDDFKVEYYAYLSEDVFSSIMLEFLRKGKYGEIFKQAKMISSNLAEKIVVESLDNVEDDFLKIFFKLCPARLSSKCLIKVYEKKGLEIIPKDRRDEELYSYVLLQEYQKGNMQCVENNIEFASASVLSKIIILEYNQGKFEFAKKHFKYTPEDIRKIILEDACKNGDISFLIEQIHCVRDREQKDNIFIQIFNNNPEDFDNIVEVFSQNRINQIATRFLDEGNLNGLQAFWKFIPMDLQREIVKKLEDNGNFEFSDKISFNGIPRDLRENGNVNRRELERFIKNAWTNGTSGRLLFRTIKTYPNSIELIRKLIAMGEDVNYASKAYGIDDPIPIIQLAMEISEKNKRNDIIYELLKANIDVSANIKIKLKAKQDKKRKPKEIYEGPCENLIEFRKIVGNMTFIRKFLGEEVHLNKEQKNRVIEFLKANKKMPTDKELYEFSFRKVIFDYFLITKKIFTQNLEVLLKPLDLLYAQIMFFRDIGIDVKNPNFMDTIGLDLKEFVKRYGAVVCKGYSGEPEELEKVVTQMLIGMYPMPSNIVQLKKCVEGDKEMILVNEDRRNGDLLRVYENGSMLEFTDEKVLPIEQRELLIEMLKSGYKVKTMELDSDVERVQREKAAMEILKKLQDPRLTEKAKIYSAYSDGGAQTAKDGKDKTQIGNRNAKVKYLVIEINGVTILEPFGQKNNATFLALNDEELKRKVTKFGRSSALENGFYKIIHEGNNLDAYNYSSNHLVRILDMAIEDKDRMLKILGAIRNDGKKYCNLLTLEAKYGAVRLAEEYGLSKDEILSVGLDDNIKEGEEIYEK